MPSTIMQNLADRQISENVGQMTNHRAIEIFLVGKYLIPMLERQVVKGSSVGKLKIRKMPIDDLSISR